MSNGGAGHVARRVEWQAVCERSWCGWRGPWRDRKFLATFDLTAHVLDQHGGAQRGEP